MPDWKEDITRRLASLKLTPVREAEITEEMAQHLEDRYKELFSGGLVEDEARRLAVEELRDADFLEKELRRIEHERPQEAIVLGYTTACSFLASLWQDIRYGLRTMSKDRGFVVAAVLALALGIGSCTAIFSVIDNVLLDPFPYVDSHRIFSIRIHDGATSE